MDYVKAVAAAALILATGSAFANPQPDQSNVARESMQQAIQRQSVSTELRSDSAENNRLSRNMISVPEARARLAKEWQKLGLSAEAAKEVASAYSPDSSSQLRHPSFKGRSDAEISGMIQKALAAKRYRMANQLLIDYERTRLRMEQSTADVHTH